MKPTQQKSKYCKEENMNSKLQLTLPIAIIPNHATSYIWSEQSEATREMFRRNVEGYNQRFGCNIDPTEQCVELWYGTEEESYQNGKLPDYWDKIFPYEQKKDQDPDRPNFDKYGNRADSLPRLMPARLFKGKKEGDRVILFDSNTVVVFGKLLQQENRYKRFGNFEDVFNFVTREENQGE